MLVFLSSLSNPQFHIAGGAVPVTPWQPESRQLETFKLNLTSVSNLEPCQTSTLISKSHTSIFLCADIEVTKLRYRSSDFLLRHRIRSLVLDFNIKVPCIWDLANPILRVGDPISDFHIRYWSSYFGLSSISGVHLRYRIPMSGSDIGSTDIEFDIRIRSRNIPMNFPNWWSWITQTAICVQYQRAARTRDPQTGTNNPNQRNVDIGDTNRARDQSFFGFETCQYRSPGQEIWYH